MVTERLIYSPILPPVVKEFSIGQGWANSSLGTSIPPTGSQPARGQGDPIQATETGSACVQRINPLINKSLPANHLYNSKGLTISSKLVLLSQRPNGQAELGACTSQQTPSRAQSLGEKDPQTPEAN